MAPSQLAALTAAEHAREELTHKAFTEKELNQFLDNLPPPPAPEPGKMTPNEEKKARKLLH
jgi:hypothetical protein